MRVRSRTLLSSVGAAALTLASLPWAGPAHAATFTVTKTADTNDGACTPNDCSLREAISAANANGPGADTINLPGGVFLLTLPPAGEDANAGGDLDVTGSLTLNGNGSTVDGNDLDRVFHILNGNVKLLNLTIRNGNTTNVGSGTNGGGVRSESGTTLELRNATVTDNVSGDDGGGIFSNGTLRIVNSLISNNQAGSDGDGDGDGGGINSEGGTVTIVGTTFSGNRAGFEGGGMKAASPTTISNSRFVGNSSDPNDDDGGDGGGLVVEEDTTLNNVQFSDNITGDDGGAIQVEGDGRLDYNGGQVSGNKAGGDGGGIDNSGTTRLNRVTIGQNVADADGDGDGDGGGFNNGGSATATQSQIGGNDDRSGDQFDNCRPANAVPGCAP